MSYFASGEEVQHELVAFLTAFLTSEEGEQAMAAARGLGDSAVLVLRTVEPETAVSVDLRSGQVALEAPEDADVELELEADALHDILLDRLDPVQISRLYEEDRVTFRGPPPYLAALVAMAGRLQPHYPASLEDRGRGDLLGTPMPPSAVTWGSPEDALAPKRLIGKRRPWQRPGRRREAA